MGSRGFTPRADEAADNVVLPGLVGYSSEQLSVFSCFEQPKLFRTAQLVDQLVGAVFAVFRTA